MDSYLPFVPVYRRGIYNSIKSRLRFVKKGPLLERWEGKAHWQIQGNG